MNWVFWVLLVAMTGLALWLIIPALLNKQQFDDTDLDQENINIARQRFKEIKAQFSAGTLTQSQFEEQYSELEVILNNDLGLTTKDNTNINSTGRWVVVPVASGLPILAVSIYLALGSFDALEMSKSVPVSAGQSQSMPDVNAMVAGLEKKLIQNPNNAEGWVMLGRSYKYLKQFQKASDAFAQAITLLGDQTELLLQFADAQAMANGGSMIGKPAEYIDKAVKQSPDNQAALWFAGIAKSQSGAYEEALQYWLHLKKLLPVDSESYQELMGLITDVQSRISPSVTTNGQAALAQSVQIKVSLSPEIKNNTQPEQTVFIYAQAMDGPKMPLAIVKEQVKNLPITVTLSDQQAMSPMMKLSDFKQIKLLARVSKSGTAMPQKGDFIGEISPISTAKKQLVKLEINKEIE